MDITRRIFLGTGAALVVGGFVGGGMALRARRAELTGPGVADDPDNPVLGNPAGDVSIVEFFDYQCPYCKRGHGDLMDMVAEDGNLRLVMKDWPIFGAPSVLASQLVLGAASMGAYALAHAALMATGGRLSAPQVRRALDEAGIDHIAAEGAYRRDRGKWDGLMSRNAAQAARLGLQGTPAFVIGNAVHQGAMGKAALRRAVARARSAAT